MPQTTDRPVDPEILKLILSCANDAAQLLDVDLSKYAPLEVVERVDQCVYDLQKGVLPRLGNEDDQPHYLLGSLWGEQMVKELGWSWEQAVFHDDGEATVVGVFSPDRSLVIYPFEFIQACLEYNVPVTILLAFNMLTSPNAVPDLPEGGYENVMENVHHIVPRE